MATIGHLIVRLTADVTKFERSLASAEKSLKRTERSFAQTARRMQSIGESLMVGVTVPLLLISGVASKAAIDFEDAFAGVRKTVDATEEQYQELARGIRRLSREIPQAAVELARLGEAAGQLGIQRSNILGFVRTMADLAETTNLAGEQGAQDLARLSNIMQMPQTQFDRLGSTIVALGNNLATTEAEILEMSLRIAGAGRVVGLTEAQVLALGGALSSVGIEAEAGGSAISRVMINMATAVSDGGRQLDMLAAVAGVSADQFRVAWQQDAAAALLQFVEGLGHLQETGGNVFGVLEALGFGEIRVRDALLRASGAGDLFRRSLELGSQAWEENTALAEEAEKRYATLASQLKIARNRAMDAAISFGQGLAPFINSVLDLIQPLLDGLARLGKAFTRLDPRIRTVIVSLGVFLALLGPTIWAIGTLARSISALIKVQMFYVTVVKRVTEAWLMWRLGAGSLREVLIWFAGGKVGLIVLGIAALAAAAIYVAVNWERFAGIAARVWNGVSAVVLYAASLMVRGLGALISVIAALVPAFRPAARAVSDYADSLKQAARSAWGLARAADSARAVQDTAGAAEQTAAAGDKAAKSQQDLADAMSEAADAAGRNLQSFDEVHQLQEDTAGSALDLAALIQPPEIPQIEIPGLDMGDFGAGSIMDGLADQVEVAGQRMAGAWQRTVAAISAWWDQLRAKAVATFPWLQSVFDGAAQAAGWIRDNWATVAPVLETVAGVWLLVGAAVLVATSPITAFVAAAGLVAAAAAWVIANWETVGPTLTGIWEAVLAVAVPIWDTLRSALSDIWANIRLTAITVWGYLRGWWARWGDTVVAILTGVWRTIGLVIETAINLVRGIIGFVLALIRGDWEAAWNYVKFIGQTIWDFIVRAVTILAETLVAIWESLQDNIAAIWDAIQARTVEVWTAITTWLTDTWNGILSAVGELWSAIHDTILGWWESVRAGTRAVWDALTGWLTGVWNGIRTTAADIWAGIRDTIGALVDAAWEKVVSVWTSIADTLERIWNGIRQTAVRVWDGIVEAVKAPINRAIGLINRFLGAVSRIKIRVPEVEIPLVGTVGGFTIGMPNIPRIPMLAEGGSITGSGLALVGETGPELLELPRGARVTPLGGGGGDLADDVAQAVYRAIIDAMRTVHATTRSGAGDREAVLRLDGRELARALLPYVIAEGQRQGLQLVVRPQGV